MILALFPLSYAASCWMIDALFQKQVQVILQGFQTRENYALYIYSFFDCLETLKQNALVFYKASQHASLIKKNGSILKFFTSCRQLSWCLCFKYLLNKYFLLIFSLRNE